MFSKVLTATDLLEACDAVVLTALEIAKQNEAQLFIIHVLESKYSGRHRQFVVDFETGEETVATTEYIQKVKDTLDKKCGGALKPYGKYEIRVRAGFPWMEILRWARQKNVDLIVMGPHAGKAEEKGVARTTNKIGSTLEAVIMRAHCPVMVVNQFIPKERLNFKKVMVCMDFSKTCEHAFKFGVKLAQKYQSELHVFHMLPVPHGYYTQMELENAMAEKKKKLQTMCQETAQGFTCKTKVTVWEGNMPYIEILKYARENAIDLIIMGSHTKEKDNKWYIGSAVEQVSLRAASPVMVVTHPKAVVKFE